MEQTFSLSSIRHRANEARKAMANAERLMIAAREELDDLQAAEHAIVRLMERGSIVQSVEGEGLMAKLPRLLAAIGDVAVAHRERINPYKADTNKALFFQVLGDAPELWLNANEIQEAASALKGSEIPMSSVSPGLSEMKNDDVIERDGLRVALKSRLKFGEAKSYHQQKLFDPASQTSNQKGGEADAATTAD